MKQLVVISGKGGTGKTSIVASMARLAGLASRKVVTADCDVEASNLALLLPGDERSREPFISGRRATVDPDRCARCLECYAHCRFGAIQMSDVATVDGFACEGCGVCALVCPLDAIGFEDRLAGQSMESMTAFGPMLHAQLGVAQDRSGKLVAALRQRALDVAKREGIELIIVDGPPGIGCPVHASLSGCDLVLAVTEPSPSGEHDLDRVLRLAEHFRMHAAVLINKYDLAPHCCERIEDMAREREVPVVGRLPFDQAIPRALARGMLPLEVETFAGPMTSAWEAVQGLLGIPVPSKGSPA